MQFPLEMMNDSLWVNRLEYEEAEENYQMFVSKAAKSVVSGEVMQVTSNQTVGRDVPSQENLTYERLHIPERYHPFIRGADNVTADEIENATGTRIKFPSPSAPKDELIVAGESEGVPTAVNMILAIFKKREKESKSLSVEVKKSHHRYVVESEGAAIQKILHSTGVSVEVPPLDSESETITLFGDEANLGMALTQLYQKVQTGFIKEKEKVKEEKSTCGAHAAAPTVESQTSAPSTVPEKCERRPVLPREMMFDESVWINRLEYDEAEATCQLILSKNSKGCKGNTDGSVGLEESPILDDGSLMNDSSEESFQSAHSDLALENEEEFGLLHSLQPSVGSVQVSDFNIIREAVMTLTRAVSTLSKENKVLTDENVKLKNRVANAEQRMDRFSKNNSSNLKGKVDKLETRIKSIDQALGKSKTANTPLSAQPPPKNLDQVKQQLLTVVQHSNQKTTDAIKKLESSQTADRRQFDDAMKSLREYLHKKDTEYKDDTNKLKLSIEDVLTKKTQSMEDVMDQIKKQQEIDKEAIQTIKNIQITKNLEKPFSKLSKDTVLANSNKSETISTSKTTPGSGTSADKKQNKAASVSKDLNTENLLSLPKESTNNDIINYLDKANEYLEYYQKGGKGNSVTTTTISSTKPKATVSKTKATECPPVVPATAQQKNNPHTAKTTTTTTTAAATTKEVSKSPGCGTAASDAGVWPDVKSLLLNSPDHSLLLSYLPIQYKKQFRKEFVYQNDEIANFLKKNGEGKIRVIGKGENSLVLYINPEDVPSYLLVNHLMCILNDCESFRATPAELSEVLWMQCHLIVKPARISKEILDYPAIFNPVNDGNTILIELSIVPRLMFLRQVMVLLVKKRKDGVPFSDFGNRLTREMEWTFTLKSYGNMRLQEVLDWCGEKFFSVTGKGNEKMVKLGALGEVYYNVMKSIESKGGALLLQQLSATYREMYKKAISFSSVGFNGVDEFVGNFSTEFTIYGQKEMKAIILNDTIINWVYITEASKENILALDCEMVAVRGKDSKQQSVAGRCSIVNYNLVAVYDKYIRPEQKIVDYRTPYSGISEQHMKNAVPFREARREIMSILKDKIIVGHSLHHDFESLNFSWPRRNRRDLSECMLLRSKVSAVQKSKLSGDTLSLKQLTSALLKRDIQKGSHSSFEDATASMELYKLVSTQWESEFKKMPAK